MKKWHKLLCTVLAVCLVLSNPVPVFAAIPFTDVAEDAWYAPYVEYVYEHSLMNGTSDTTFAPNTNMSRAMVVTVLHRLEASPDASALLPFKDVPAGQYYTKAVQWSYENEIVNGTSKTTFAPNANVTREQLVTIFYRYAKFKGLDTSARANLSGYKDRGSISSFASEAFQWAVSCGIINGTTATALSPKGNASRAQCAAILLRFIKWRFGNPGIPSGAALVSSPQNFTACNSYAPKNGLQEISYWSNFTVYYKTEPNINQERSIYRLNGMSRELAVSYVEMLQRNGYTLQGSYSRKDLYSWGLTCDRTPGAALMGMLYDDSVRCHVQIWHSSDGWFLYVSPGLEVCDLGIRINKDKADRTPWGFSADSGLVRMSDGSYQTLEGKLNTSPGHATVVVDGTSTTCPVVPILTDNGNLQLKILTGSDTLIRLDYKEGSLQKNSTLRRQELEDEGVPDLRVRIGSSLHHLDNTSKYLKQCTVRVMEKTDSIIVYYIYAALNVAPYDIEALCVIRVGDIETPADREDNKDNNNNNNNNDDDNDYGSALTCTACRGSGDCSKCGGDGKIWSSAAGKENRNCTKCNASGRCPTCNGSGKRYN